MPPRIVFVRELQNGWETPVNFDDLPPDVQKGIDGSAKAGCHAFTWQDGKEMKTVVVENQSFDKTRRK